MHFTSTIPNINERKLQIIISFNKIAKPKQLTCRTDIFARRAHLGCKIIKLGSRNPCLELLHRVSSSKGDITTRRYRTHKPIKNNVRRKHFTDALNEVRFNVNLTKVSRLSFFPKLTFHHRRCGNANNPWWTEVRPKSGFLPPNLNNNWMTAVIGWSRHVTGLTTL